MAAPKSQESSSRPCLDNASALGRGRAEWQTGPATAFAVAGPAAK